jgi:hypothetical protein
MMTCRRDDGFPSSAHGASGEMLMYRHGATCLTGPVSLARVWWTAPIEANEVAENRALAAPPSAPEEIRQDLVARVRREIAEGTYETPEKLETALARLLNRL